VYPILSHKTQEDVLYTHGVSVEMHGALRDFNAKKWKATHVQGHQNMFLVTCPMLPKGLTNTADITQRNEGQTESVTMGRANAMKKYKDVSVNE